MPTTFMQTLVNMTEEQKAVAMAARGMKPDGSPLISDEDRWLGNPWLSEALVIRENP